MMVEFNNIDELIRAIEVVELGFYIRKGDRGKKIYFSTNKTLELIKNIHTHYIDSEFIEDNNRFVIYTIEGIYRLDII